MSTQGPQRFTILHVTDIHEGNTLYPRLAAYLSSHPTHPRHIDLIAVTGDQLNLMHPLEGHVPGGHDYIPADDAVRQAWKAVLYDGVAKTLRSPLSSAAQQLRLPRVLWIPGNHDPMESYAREDPDAWLGEKGKAEVPEGVVPVHERMIRLAPGLVAVGVGGSVPAYWSEGAGNGKEGEEVWPGCPWRSEEQLKNESLAPHVIPLMQKAVDNGDQVVFLTHSGPATSATTLIRTDATERDPIWKFYHHVNSGSLSFLDILRAPPKPASGEPVTRPLIPLVLHGHSHWSRGVHRINASTVVNPGSFKDCAAGLIELRCDAESGEWKVGTVELIEF